MTASTLLERRYRRLLAFYAAAFRREHEEEILAVLVEGATDGQERPGLAESVNLLTHAISTRLDAKGLRGWWASPLRPGVQRLINPWAYRRLRLFGVMQVAGGIVAAGIGAFIISYGAYGWAAFFLAIGALNLAGGYWFLTIARSASPRA